MIRLNSTEELTKQLQACTTSWIALFPARGKS